MKIITAISIVVAAVYSTAAPPSAQAAARIVNNRCFSGVGSDAATAQDECEKAGFTCTAPKVMKCDFDNVRQEYICQCKTPKKNPGVYDERQPRGEPPKEELEPTERGMAGGQPQSRIASQDCEG